jgi:hypothetical protein
MFAEPARAGGDPAYGISGLHVFTFNTVGETQRSLARIARDHRSLTPARAPAPDRAG